MDGIRDRVSGSDKDKDKDRGRRRLRGNGKERNGDRDAHEKMGLIGKESKDGDR